MYSIFKILLERAGVSSADVSKATWIPASTFTAWKQGISKPKQEKLAKIADYFDVPDQYILARGGWASDYVMKSVYRNAITDEARKQDERIADHFSKLKPCN